MKTITDFTIDAAKDEKLASESRAKLEEGKPDALHSWFQEKGYDVPLEECQKMIDNKDHLKAERVGVFW